jgi:hypothetical protein
MMQTTQTKTIASLFEALDSVRRLWNVLAVGAPPEDKQLAIWMQQFTEEELIYAFKRIGMKRMFHAEPDAAHRYVTSILVAERRKARAMNGFDLLGEKNDTD